MSREAGDGVAPDVEALPSGGVEAPLPAGVEAAALHRTLDLPDGRRLCYAELGDPSGYPVLSCHGGLVSRLDVVPAHEAARRAGVRLVSPDRPGVGRSSRRPGRRVGDWPADVAVLADRLGLDRLSVLGWSMGAPYALACGALLGDRVQAAVVVAGAVPLSWPCAGGTFPNRTDAAVLDLVRRRPATAHLLAEASRSLVLDQPAVWLATVRRSLLPADLAAIERDGLAQYRQAVAEGLADPLGVADEYLAYDAPWGFAYGEVRCPVVLWQGSADTAVPPGWSEEAARRLPRASLELVDGAGHFVARGRWDGIFARLLAAAASSGRGERGAVPR